MPELPEVQTVANQLQPILLNQRVASSRVFDPRLAVRLGALKGLKIKNVTRLGKQIVIHLQGKKGSKAVDKYLAVHLRMTGRLIWETHKAKRLANKSLRCELKLGKGYLGFYDVRRFGTVKVVSDIAEISPSGIDPMSSEFTARKLSELIGSSTQSAKQWLLRQDKIVGIGNIYASEILFAAKIHPERAIGSTDLAQRKEICRHTKRILKKAIENCGTTFSDFQDSSGEIGSYGKYLAVYGRLHQSCRSCKSAKIQRISQAGRSTFFCPNCQKISN